MINHESFKRSLLKCFGNGGVPKNIVVALSGGADSLCLTYLLTKYKQKYDPTIDLSAVTIDHKYRECSTKDAYKVGKLVESWGVNHIIKTLQYDKDVRGITNFEEVARLKRYEKFQETCHELGANTLFVAHNLNDQLETYLQRLQQNSSLFGLVGLRSKSLLPVSPGGPLCDKSPISVIRPLLEYDKAEIINTCTQNNLEWFEDHTNSDIHLTKRNLLRYLINEVVPKKFSDTNDESCRCELKLVTKQALIDTHHELVALTDSIQHKVNILIGYLTQQKYLKMNARDGSLDVALPFTVISPDNSILLSRLLYQILYPISSVKHYHWSYAKLERHAVPRISNYFNNNSHNAVFKITYLNILFEIRIDTKANMINLRLSRQPISRDDIKRISLRKTLTSNWTDWMLFDRRYWLRCKSKIGDITVDIVPYEINAHKSLLLPFFKDPKQVVDRSKHLDSVPIIIHDGSLIAIPTYNLCYDNLVDLECHLKDNLYEPGL